jgi:hypothetical protein
MNIASLTSRCSGRAHGHYKIICEEDLKIALRFVDGQLKYFFLHNNTIIQYP